MFRRYIQLVKVSWMFGLLWSPSSRVKWSQESQGVREKIWVYEADLIFLCLLVGFKYFYSLIMYKKLSEIWFF